MMGRGALRRTIFPQMYERVPAHRDGRRTEQSGSETDPLLQVKVNPG